MSIIIKRTTTKTYEIVTIALDTFTYDAEFRHIRSQHKRQYSSCFSCQRNFTDGEKTSLANLRGTPNELLCHDCAVKLQSELDNVNKERDNGDK
jgi:hypothetical protein